MTLDLNKTLTDMYKQRREHQLNKRKRKIEEVAVDDFKPRATFDQLYGCDNIKEEFIKLVECFKESIGEGKKIPKKPNLVIGSSGLGKSTIVEAAAKYGDLKFIRLPFKKLSKKSRNELETQLDKFHDQCIENQEAVILLDDINKLFGKEEKMDLLEDLLDRLSQDNIYLLIFCTTSSILDKYIETSFSSIELKRPDASARCQILSALVKTYRKMDELKEETLKAISLDTPSFTPADLDDMIQRARVESKGSLVKLEHCKSAINKIKESFEHNTHLIAEKPNTTWDDIGGMTKVKEAFLSILHDIKTGYIDYQFASIVLYGPPGCGKTMVAKAMANEAGFNFISIGPGQLQSKYFGETEQNIREVFRQAREFEPCLIYFDEFDGFCGTRDNKNNLTSSIQTLLSEMDGFASRGKSIILASTNRLEDIDPAMLRPGRLTQHIEVGLPDEKERKSILDVLISGHKLTSHEDVDLASWVKQTKGFSGADLSNFIYEARPRSYLGKDGMSTKHNILREDNLKYAYNKVMEDKRKLSRKQYYQSTR